MQDIRCPRIITRSIGACTLTFVLLAPACATEEVGPPQSPLTGTKEKGKPWPGDFRTYLSPDPDRPQRVWSTDMRGAWYDLRVDAQQAGGLNATYGGGASLSERLRPGLHTVTLLDDRGYTVAAAGPHEYDPKKQHWLFFFGPRAAIKDLFVSVDPSAVPSQRLHVGFVNMTAAGERFEVVRCGGFPPGLIDPTTCRSESPEIGYGEYWSSELPIDGVERNWEDYAAGPGERGYYGYRMVPTDSIPVPVVRRFYSFGGGTFDGVEPKLYFDFADEYSLATLAQPAPPSM